MGFGQISPFNSFFPAVAHAYYNNPMKKFLLALLLLFFIGSFPHALAASASASSNFVPAHSSAAELLDAVNSLRLSHGLAPYQSNSILNGIAQAQADYLVAISTITHTGPDGSRPYQRALAAGYLLAGDLSQGGFFSENITAGVGQTAQEAVDVWMGDAPHQNTMLSGTLVDAGAGVGVYANTFYYVLDCGRSTGGTPVAYTPVAPLHPNTPTILPNTPNPDGSIIHIVQTGDTLGSLSLAYNVPLADILKLNNLTLTSVIYVGQKIKISNGFTPTPTQPTGTPTIRPTITEWPTFTPVDTPVDSTPTQTPLPGLPSSSVAGTATIIVVAAVLLAGAITLVGARKKK